MPALAGDGDRSVVNKLAATTPITRRANPKTSLRSDDAMASCVVLVVVEVEMGRRLLLAVFLLLS
jgi:hypothetical protein